MAAFEIPLIASPQVFSITLAETQYRARVSWNVPANCWILDLLDLNENPLIEGIPLVTGVDLLEQFPDFDFGGQLFVQTDGSINKVPGYADLGSTGHLYFVTPD